jgi:hypothetical protein
MKLIVYDCEVFAHDWIVVLKDVGAGRHTVVHNDNEALKCCITDDNVYIGFNSKHYDQFIVKAICCDFTPREIKQVNDYIIGGGQGWECPMLQGQYFRFNNVDIMDDMQMGLSLKAIEGHLGMSIEDIFISIVDQVSEIKTKYDKRRSRSKGVTRNSLELELADAIVKKNEEKEENK